MSYKRDGLSGSFGNMDALEDEPPVDWLIKGWVPSNELLCLYGKGGTFKSYVAIGWTLQLARKGKNTLYIGAEGTSGLRSRVEAWMNQRGVPKNMDGWHYYNSGVHLDDPGHRRFWFGHLDKYMELNGVDTEEPGALDLVVVDTLARNFSGDENSAKEMGEFVEGCEELRRRYGAAVLVVHHTTKDGKDVRGTDSLRNATFAMYRTRDPRYTKTGGGSVKVVCERMKDAVNPEAVRVKFDTIGLDANDLGEVHRVSQAMEVFPPKKAPKKVSSK